MWLFLKCISIKKNCLNGPTFSVSENSVLKKMISLSTMMYTTSLYNIDPSIFYA